jgi:hypothetical protein
VLPLLCDTLIPLALAEKMAGCEPPMSTPLKKEAAKSAASDFSSHDKVCTDRPELCNREDSPYAIETTEGNNIPGPSRNHMVRISMHSCTSIGCPGEGKISGAQVRLLSAPSWPRRSASKKARQCDESENSPRDCSTHVHPP